jgi:hypothetical protein
MRRILNTAMALAVVATTLMACGRFDSGSSDDSPASGKAGSAPATRPKQLFAETFKPACEGVPIPFAKPYDKASPGHKAILFMPYREGGLVDSSSELPTDWTVTFDVNGDAFAAVDLTICVKRTAVTFTKDCTGYEVDDKPDALVVKMHTATYVMTVHEASTGTQLAAQDVRATNTSCPTSLYAIPAGTTTMNEYARPSAEEIIAFAKPIVQP